MRDFAWHKIVERATKEYKTPFYISAWNPVLTALEELKILESTLPVQHWLSFKTHPVPPLVRAWRTLGYGAEVVSEYEFLAAIEEGFKPEKVLVNGVAKHRWLNAIKIRGIRVHFDSLCEVDALIDHAVNHDWRVGIRFHTNEECDPDEPEFTGQFGMQQDEAIVAIAKLRKKGVLVDSIHFHLRTNVSSADSYKRAIKEISHTCNLVKLTPTYFDCGGGLPVVAEKPIDQTRCQPTIDLTRLRRVLSEVPSDFPSVREIWLENGRFISARSAVLVIRVLDIKERKDSRYLICNGGRTNHALVSDWEMHDISILPPRSGKMCLTTVCGPTCMAFDRLIRKNLPNDIQVGDYIIWHNAGAYHIPWETRFSFGLAKVLWYDEEGRLKMIREKESFIHWWGQWK